MSEQPFATCTRCGGQIVGKLATHLCDSSTERHQRHERREKLPPFTKDEWALIHEALDSHVYWELSDQHYRKDGEVVGLGSDDFEQQQKIKDAAMLMLKVHRAQRIAK